MKKPRILLFCCLFSIVSFAQSNDWDFENWEDGQPTGWITSVNTTQDTVNSTEFCCRFEPFLDGTAHRPWLKGTFIVNFNELPKFFSFNFKAAVLTLASTGFLLHYRIRLTYPIANSDHHCSSYLSDYVFFKRYYCPKDWKQIVVPISTGTCATMVNNDSLISLKNVVVEIEFEFEQDHAFATEALGLAWLDAITLSPVNPQNMFSNLDYKDVLISGETETIKWDGGPDTENLILSYSINDGALYQQIGIASPGSIGQLDWEIPAGLLADKCRLKLTVEETGEDLDISNVFYIKPYSLTRLESNGEMTQYNIWTDRWGFENNREHVWPVWYTNQINYNGIDEHTGQLYDHLQGDSVFFNAKAEDFPAWGSYTGTFSVPTCYDDLITALYNHKALLSWKNKKYQWNGSCFGIAASNALAFESKNDFLNAYPNFGNFAVPYTVSPGMGTVATVTELFTHQIGNPSIYNDIAGNGLKTPTQTVEDIKKMFSTGHTEIRTLTMYNNSGSGGHTIVPYKLEQDTVNEQYYYIYVYDNEIPDSTNARIRVDVSANGGVGSWEPLYGWPGWGGDKDLYLEIPSSYYYVNATLKKATSYYSLLDSIIEISPNDGANIRIKNVSGNTSGYMDDQLLEEIPDVHALMHKDGSESPPYSYLVPAGEYTIDISNPENKAAEGYVFTKDQLFYYERKNTAPEQTDRLLYNGSLTAINPDDEARNIKMMLILEEEDEEKVFKLNPFKLEKEDSVKVESPDNKHIILSNYGSAKQYGVELHHVSSSGFERFVNDSIPIGENTSHLFEVNWTDVEESVLTVYVDNEMDGSFEDTLLLNYHVTGVDDQKINSLIADLNLQVWPNPAEDKITFSYRLNSDSKISIKIFDSLGREIITPLNVERQIQGKHNLPVNIAELPAGIYYYHFIVNNYKVNGKIVKI